MSIRCLLIAGLFLVALRPAVEGQTSNPAPRLVPTWSNKSEPGSKVMPVAAQAPATGLLPEEKKPSLLGLDLSFLDTGDPVTASDPTVADTLWQRTWGIAGFNGYPVGRKMAPNGVPYDPLFSIDLQLNIALTRERDVYIFGKSRFWGQKPEPGITNAAQGGLDFSKRQYDLEGGVAWNYTGRFEARAQVYSFNNLNRGTSLARPFGYNDGFSVENRYYLPSTDFDKGLYRFVGIGYYASKDLIGANGETFKPSLYFNANLALDIIPERFYAFSDLQFITMRPFAAKLFLADVGFALRPFPAIPDLEFRVGADNNVDLALGFTRTLFYTNVRIVW